MTTDDDFLAAILASPGENLPRLVYADWLEEHDGATECPACGGKGRQFAHAAGVGGTWIGCDDCGGSGRVPNHFAERAEFIRCQIKLARLEFESACDREDEPHRCRPFEVSGKCFPCQRKAPLHTREAELFEAHAVRWFDTPGLGAIRLRPFAADSRRHFPFGIVRRGFVAEVRLTLAAFLGGRCPRCAGTGFLVQPNEYRVNCGDCNRTGQLPSLAGDLFLAHPIERVVPTDRQARRVREEAIQDHLARPRLMGVDDIGEPDMYFFRVVGDMRSLPPTHDLPHEVFDRLEGSVVYQGHEHLKFYRTEAKAAEALNAVLVEIGRERAAETKAYRSKLKLSATVRSV